MDNFNNAVEVLTYFAEQCGAFKPIKEEFVNLQEENKNLKMVNEKLTKELASNKVDSMIMKSSNEKLTKEIANTKLKVMQIETKINGGIQ